MGPIWGRPTRYKDIVSSERIPPGILVSDPPEPRGATLRQVEYRSFTGQVKLTHSRGICYFALDTLCWYAMKGDGERVRLSVHMPNRPHPAEEIEFDLPPVPCEMLHALEGLVMRARPEISHQYFLVHRQCSHCTGAHHWLAMRKRCLLMEHIDPEARSVDLMTECRQDPMSVSNIDSMALYERAFMEDMSVVGGGHWMSSFRECALPPLAAAVVMETAAASSPAPEATATAEDEPSAAARVTRKRGVPQLGEKKKTRTKKRKTTKKKSSVP
jgi:hypothetical protein